MLAFLKNLLSSKNTTPGTQDHAWRELNSRGMNLTNQLFMADALGQDTSHIKTEMQDVIDDILSFARELVEADGNKELVKIAYRRSEAYQQFIEKM